MRSNMNLLTRRKMMVTGAAAIAGGTVLLSSLEHASAADVPSTDRARDAAPATGKSNVDQAPLPPGEAGKDYTPVVTPNGATLPWKLVDGVKVFHLIAE